MLPREAADPRLQHAMKRVLLATIPGLAVLLWLYGWGLAINLLLAASTAVAVEALVLRLRRRAVMPALSDGSALVSAALLAIALPAFCPWWLTVSATACALLFGKHLYGGVGQNPFNPAMLGYALVLVCFPHAMTQWPGLASVSLPVAMQQVFGIDFGAPLADAWSQATVLDSLRINNSLTVDELFASNPAFGHWGGKGSEWANLGFLAGGAFLLQQRIITWHAPVGLLVGLFVMGLLFWNGTGSDSNGSPLFHWLSGATVLGAFFIVTEPVSGPRTAKARLCFGAGVGILTYVIRTWGGYPDGLAFAVLLMNLGVPALDRLFPAPASAP